MISFSNVFVKYTKEFYALSNISFEADKGEVVALIGPKDSGKTCMLRLIAGLEKQDKGEVYIKNIPLAKVDYSVDVSMGYIPYKATFFEKKTVYDNLKYILETRKTENNLIEEKINQAIIDFKLESIAQEKIYKLTLFQKYLVSVARLSFRNQLDVVLIDNLFEELSSNETKELIKCFKKYFVKPSTLLIIATSDEQIADSIATKKIFLRYGTIDKVENN